MAEAATTEYRATGRRKTSVAQIRLSPGSGRVTVNGRRLDEYMGVPTQRATVVEALEATQTAGRFDVMVTVRGGGPAGQADAIRLGVARALLQAEPDLKAALRGKGLLTRDPRMRERKKYGQPGARKRFQFSKR